MSHFITFGNYIFLDKIGEGGVAEVWRACKQDDLYQDVPNIALKRMLSDCGEEMHQLFTREASLASDLTHPNLVQIREFGEVEGRLFLEMELVEGIDVASLMMAQDQERLTLSIEVAAYIIREVAKGLAHAHQQNLIHRDVSPQNVLLSIQGEVKLTDFGVAITHGIRETGKPLGKPGYMPPEQLAQSPASPKWDIFALGVLFWEMLTGSRLFHGQTPEKMLQQIQKGVVAPSEKNSNVPPLLDEICVHALHNNPEKRYASAQIFYQEIDKVFSPWKDTVSTLQTLVHENFPPTCAVPPSYRSPSQSHGHLIALDPDLLPSATENTSPSMKLTAIPAKEPVAPSKEVTPDASPVPNAFTNAKTPALGMEIPPPPKNAPIPGLAASLSPFSPKAIETKDQELSLNTFQLPPADELELRPIRIELPDEDEEEEESSRPMFDAPQGPPNWILWIGALFLIAFVIGSAVWMILREG